MISSLYLQEKIVYSYSMNKKFYELVSDKYIIIIEEKVSPMIRLNIAKFQNMSNDDITYYYYFADNNQSITETSDNFTGAHGY